MDEADGVDGVLLGRVLAAAEPELVLRRGLLRAARLVRVGAAGGPPGEDADAWAGRGTVVVTGGTGGLGAVVARHLAVVHGVRDLLLVSRRGPDAPEAAELAADLGRLGVRVAVVACDVSDRGALAAVLAGIPADRPVTGVIHAEDPADNEDPADGRDIASDGEAGSLGGGELDRVLAARVDAAWHLHELTAGMDLAVFVTFSSLAVQPSSAASPAAPRSPAAPWSPAAPDSPAAPGTPAARPRPRSWTR